VSTYKRCLVWDIELFFKWIKQHLRIKKFYGTSENAVKTQIWIAVSIYVLVAIIRKRLKLEVSLYTLMQVFSVTAFEKASIESVILQTTDSSEYVLNDNQLNLFSY
jgi:IS4 transposase